MRIIETIATKLTFANVVACLALVVATGGTAAYAADIGKNTVGSKQIVNSSITSKDVKDKSLTGEDVDDGTITGGDVKDGSLTGADVAGDSLGGGQINEQSLGAVPNAAALGGVAASGFQKASTQVTGNFTAGSPLTLSVSGYGTFRLLCDPSGPQYDVSNGLGTNPIEGVTITAASGPLNDAVTRVFNPDGANTSATFGHTGNRMTVDALHRSADAAKEIHVTAYGWVATGGCFGFIEGQILR